MIRLELFHQDIVQHPPFGAPCITALLKNKSGEKVLEDETFKCSENHSKFSVTPPTKVVQRFLLFSFFQANVKLSSNKFEATKYGAF